jgi:4-hydroxy-tetrahydrodipicolinate synthase
MFQGSMVALVTPMRDGAVDAQSLMTLVDWHLAQGTHALVILGTTGESVTLTADERAFIMSSVIEQVAGRVPVIVGTGSNSTDQALLYTKQALVAGADGCLLVTPYYNKPSQEGLYQHFSVLAQGVSIPQILYNVPGRTGCDLLPETVVRLAEHANIVGLKDATGDLSRVTTMIEQYGAPLDLFSGDDASSCAFMALGGKGAISVTANVVPAQMAQMMQMALTGDYEEAKILDSHLTLLHRDLFVDSNPVPVKWLLAHMGKIATDEVRLPLVALAQEKRQVVAAALTAALAKVAH